MTLNGVSRSCGPIRGWLTEHPRIHHACIPVGAAWLHLIAGWWRLFRRKAFAGEFLADANDSAYTRPATAQLDRHAHPWVWGRLASPPVASPLCGRPLTNDA